MIRPVLLASLVLVGCVAPPLGLGGGAHTTTARSNDSNVATGVAVGTAPGREAFQAEAAMQFHHSKRFAWDVGAAYTQVAMHHDGMTRTLIGLMPYLRGRWTGDRVSASLAGWMFGASGETGAAGGILDAQLGVGGDSWSVYGGAYGMGYGEGLGPLTGAVQGRLGAELLWCGLGGRVGVGVEVYAQYDSIGGADSRGDPIETIDSRFVGGAIKLRYESSPTHSTWLEGSSKPKSGPAPASASASPGR